ncbi:MAG: hypothetical protein E8A46_23170 [Bradyrhizobium sp.]|nr:MAG: hypothetical protein E8A46_23170 [Bradyrhizobium sp.]
MVLAPGCALAEKRVALIVGNSTYQSVPQLPNPSRDASAVARMFKDAGFDSVDVQLDVGNLEFKRSIRKFEAMADQADIAVIYYAGHGLEIGGTNYLIPIDARLASDRDADDEAIPLERLVATTDGAKRLRLVILDACRDNPFVTKMRRERANRAITSGLSKVEPTSTDTLIAYAAKAGSTADDGDGQHSPFTSALLKNLTVPGLDVRLAFGRVRDDVLKSTGNRQEPFVYGSLGGETMALVPQIAKPVDAEAGARVDYELAAQIGTKEAWDSFLASHPSGLYANLARAQNNKLSAAQESHSKADDARREAEEQAALKAEELRRQTEEQSTRQTAEARQKLSEQAKKELEEAKKQVELAQQQAEAARQQVAEAKRQAVAEAQLQVEQASRAAREDAEKVATLTPGQTTPQTPPPVPQLGQADLTRLLQAHLKRVGCNTGNVDGHWDDSSSKALDLFNKNAKTQFDIKLASLDALDAVRNKSDRVCPLICGKGQRAEGDRCVQIECGSGYFLNSGGSCKKRREPAPRARTARRYPAPQPFAPPPQSGSSGACGLDSSGHRQANVRTC